MTGGHVPRVPPYPDGRSDAEIIAGSIAEMELFGVIVHRYLDVVYRFAARSVGESEAGDIVSDVFARALVGRGRYDEGLASVPAWLYGIARNVVHKHRAREGRRRHLNVTYVDPDQADTDPYPAADARIDATASTKALARALAGLHPSQRETLELHVVEGLSHREVAEVMGIPVGTVKSRIFRALASLRQLVPDPDSTPPEGDHDG